MKISIRLLFVFFISTTSIAQKIVFSDTTFSEDLKENANSIIKE